MNATTPPDWDLNAYFEGLDDPAYQAFVALLERDLRQIPARIGADDDLVDVLLAAEDALGRLWHLSSYLGCRSAAEGNGRGIGKAVAHKARLAALSSKLTASLTAAIGALDEEAYGVLRAAPALADAGHVLTRFRRAAIHQMPGEQEHLAAELGVDGLHAWGRLYDSLTGAMHFTLEVPGEAPRRVPMAQARGLMEGPDAAVRAAALAGSNAVWAEAAPTLAAALNGIAGSRLTLQARRGWPHFLGPALEQAEISHATLEALLGAVTEERELARRIFRAKRRHLGLESLGWQDRAAPLPGDDAALSWEDGHGHVRAAFRRAYPGLGDYADLAVAEGWIDHTARPGKRPGAFCTSSPITRQSRVFMTFQGSMRNVQTLAHELGHAFHNHLMRDLRPWARQYPMTLAETASTFAEQVVQEATLAREDLSDGDRLALLDHGLSHAGLFLLDIPVRYHFEHALYTRRAEGELSVEELCQLMADTQREVFGDALDPEQADPYYWCSKLHFYMTGVSFYNMPYTFGFLFSTALYARWKAEGDAFVPTYERLLRATGRGTAEQVVRDVLGEDLEDVDFWRRSIATLAPDVARYESL